MLLDPRCRWYRPNTLFEENNACEIGIKARIIHMEQRKRVFYNRYLWYRVIDLSINPRLMPHIIPHSFFLVKTLNTRNILGARKTRFTTFLIA